MAENVELPDGMFPTLDASQIAHLVPLGEERHLAAGEIIYDQGDAEHGVFVVLSGSVELVNVVNGEETVLMVHGVGKFTGEVNQLSGRRSLIRCHALETSTVVEISRANLRHIFENDAEMSEIMLRAFLLRRVYLIRNSVGDAVLIGSSHSADTLRLQEFL